MAATSPEFQKAAEEAKKLNMNDQGKALQLYGLFKIANGGGKAEQEADLKSAGIFDMKKKTMNKAWASALETTTDPEEAQKQYIALVEKFKAEYGLK